jgi:ankyrin repeat protein
MSIFLLGSSSLVKELQGNSISTEDLNARDDLGYTILHEACKAFRFTAMDISLVPFLLARRDIDVNAKAHYGKTPLHLAIRDHRDSAKYLLQDPRVDITIKDDFGKTAFANALRWGESKDTIEMFIATGKLDESHHREYLAELNSSRLNVETYKEIYEKFRQEPKKIIAEFRIKHGFPKSSPSAKLFIFLSMLE